MTRITTLRACLLLFAAATLGLTGCMRGGLSTEPPVHLVLGMDFQQKLRAQAETHFEGWGDGRASRLPVSYVAGTSVRPLVVAQDSLPDPKLAYGCVGACGISLESESSGFWTRPSTVLDRWSRRQWSLVTFLACSLSTAWISRPTLPSPSRGQMKKDAKRSSAPSSAGAWQSQ